MATISAYGVHIGYTYLIYISMELFNVQFIFICTNRERYSIAAIKVPLSII